MHLGPRPPEHETILGLGHLQLAHAVVSVGTDLFMLCLRILQPMRLSGQPRARSVTVSARQSDLQLGFPEILEPGTVD